MPRLVRIGLVLLVRGTAEQRTKHGDRANPRYLIEVADILCGEEAGDGKALPVPELDRRNCFPLGQRWDHCTLNLYGICEIEFADRRENSKIDGASRQHSRREV